MHNETYAYFIRTITYCWLLGEYGNRRFFFYCWFYKKTHNIAVFFFFLIKIESFMCAVMYNTG